MKKIFLILFIYFYTNSEIIPIDEKQFKELGSFILIKTTKEHDTAPNINSLMKLNRKLVAYIPEYKDKMLTAFGLKPTDCIMRDQWFIIENDEDAKDLQETCNLGRLICWMYCDIIL